MSIPAAGSRPLPAPLAFPILQWNESLAAAVNEDRLVDIQNLLPLIPPSAINATNGDGDTYLHLAARKGLAKMVKLLLLQPEINCDIRNNQGSAALREAYINDHSSVISAFNGLLWDEQLAVVISRGDLSGVQKSLPLDPPSSINAINGNGDTYLHLAARQTRIDIVDLLLSQPGIDPNIRNNNGKIPLAEALNNTTEGQESITSRLLLLPGTDLSAITQ